jgi:hypothetical protein
MPALFAEQATTSLLDILSNQLNRMNPGDLTGVFFLGGMMAVGLVVSLTAMITQLIQKHHTRQTADSLIRDMLDRGVAPDDIVRILSAAGLEDSRHRAFRKLGKFVSQAVAQKEKVAS